MLLQVGIFVNLLIRFSNWQFLKNCLQVMDRPPTLTQFSGKIGNGPGFAEFLVRLTVILREKDLHQATKNVMVPNAENIYRPIPLNSSTTITKEAYTKDRSLSAILMNSLNRDAFAFATQKFPINEDTKDDDFIGLRLWLGLKARYDVALIRSEIFKKKTRDTQLEIEWEPRSLPKRNH